MNLTPEQYQLNRQSAANIAKTKLNLNGISPSNWSYADRVAYDKELAATILAYPSRFSEQDIINASRVDSKTYSELQENSFVQTFQDFGSAVVDQAVSINDAVNPFSEKNRKIILWVAVTGVAAYFLLPVILKSIRGYEEFKPNMK